MFAELVLADEINRAPAKTQAALLEAMQEFQVTIDGTTHRLPNPFFVIATENPVESEGTYPLPEAQLDRFIVRAHLGYPAVADEVEMVARRLARGTDEVVIRQVTNTVSTRRGTCRHRTGARRAGAHRLRRRHHQRQPQAPRALAGRQPARQPRRHQGGARPGPCSRAATS